MRWLKDIVRGLSAGHTDPKGSSGVRLLAVMPKSRDSQALSQIAGKAQWDLEFAPNYEAAIEMVRHERFLAILCDRDLTNSSDWREGIVTLALRAPDSSIILASPVNDDFLWQEVIRLGGYDVLTKPFQEERVLRSIQFAWSSRQHIGRHR